MFLINLYIHSHAELLGLAPFVVEVNKYLLLFIATPIFIMKQVSIFKLNECLNIFF